MNTQQLSIEEREEIEYLLGEASAWGLETEVKESAEKYMLEGHSIVDAYHFAFEDWIK